MFKHNNQGLDDALALSIRGKVDESYKILCTLDNQDPRVRFNLGWHEIRFGRLYSGYQYIESGRLLGAFGGSSNINAPRYNGEPLKDKTLLFHGEGGFGDEIINIRFAKYFHELGAKVVVGCSKELYSLFDKLPFISTLIDRKVCIHCNHDYWVPSMSAPTALKLEYNDLNREPYLDMFSKRWVPKNKSKFKIGLRWAGNPKFEHEQHRKFPVEKILNLTRNKTATFYSLQRDDDLVENMPCIDMRYEMKTWKDTAEIIASMDLIITSCTSIAHLSAAMGKHTWVIAPILPYYIWSLPIENSPWYKNVKLYRQTEYGNWEEPFSKIEKDLAEIIGKSYLD